MVQKLTQNLISFYKPFFSEAFCFFQLANRTISLFTISLVQRVSKLTNNLSFIYSSYRQRVFKGILIFSNTSEMQMIDTCPISAGVVNNHTLWNVSIGKVISNTMRSSAFFEKVKTTVTIFIKIISPQNAFPFWSSKRKESLFNCFHVGHYIPLIS